VTSVVDHARQLVAQEVDAHRQEFAELIDRELDRQLAALVVERLAARNGHASPRGEASALPCSRCGNEPRLAGRTIGRRCKTADDVARQRRRTRERRTPAPSDDGPRPGPSAQPE
jgi:nucleotidyltransferase/DNA polymerase involved in DNA repair